MPSLRHQLLTRVIPVLRHRSELGDVDELRRELLAQQAAADPSPPPRIAKRFEISVRTRHGLPVHELQLPGDRPSRSVVYVHGGGFVGGLDRFHWRYAARLARELHVRVLLPSYPLAPAHTWKDSVPPLVEVFADVASESPDGVALAGDSAGGGLAAALAQRLAGAAGPQPTHLVLFAPFVDLTLETPGTDEAAARDPWLTLSKARLYGRWWGDGRPADPDASPLFADLAGLPPTLLMCGTRDLLQPQVRELALRAEQAAVAVTYVEEPGLMHVYPLLPVPEAERAWSQVKAFL